MNSIVMWQGKFFQEKAREADEESNEMILRTRLASFSLKFCGVCFNSLWALVNDGV